MNVLERRELRLGVAAPEKCPRPAACASLLRQPSLLAMTHMLWRHGRSGHESTGYTESVLSTTSVGGLPGPSTRAQTGTRADVNVRPRHLVERKEKNRKEKKREEKRREEKRKEKKKKKEKKPGRERHRNCSLEEPGYD